MAPIFWNIRFLFDQLSRYLNGQPSYLYQNKVLGHTYVILKLCYVISQWYFCLCRMQQKIRNVKIFWALSFIAIYPSSSYRE